MGDALGGQVVTMGQGGQLAKKSVLKPAPSPTSLQGKSRQA